ncbi:putative extracellular metalloprotease [Amylocarpus encephaloides]|uniref:Extracellular metalloprotease n=1 Tax=Amylocarpus encephaloides TaxID=45428 RepID=A0A9P8C1V0_9HELO|nr:putative extracellular metalloprotease [Amylocarpus encephaloides]
MRFTAAVLSLASLAPVFAHPWMEPREIVVHPATLPHSRNGNPSPCGTDPSAEFIAAVEDMSIAEANGTFANSNSRIAAATISVNVYFHVVAINTTPDGGYLTASQITQQVTYMNNAFAGTGFQFVNAGTDYTINTSWANDRAESTMKRSLRKGTYKDINIYFQYFLEDNNLGYCYFPTSSGKNTGSSAFYTDGCTILASSVAGGPLANYNLGGTAAHEVGHWMGLLHTFEGSACSSTNDGIDDTPAQNGYTRGCPDTRDSCPSAGLDPIHNYMDYSYDICYTEFTPNQATRMNSMWTRYRV